MNSFYWYPRFKVTPRTILLTLVTVPIAIIGTGFIGFMIFGIFWDSNEKVFVIKFPIAVIFFVGLLFFSYWLYLFKGERDVLTEYELDKFGHPDSRADYIRYYRGYERQYYVNLQDLEKNKKNNLKWRVEEEILRLSFLTTRKHEQISGIGALILLSTSLTYFFWV